MLESMGKDLLRGLLI